MIDDGVRARLRRVMLLFTAGTAVTLSSVHVWDGPTPVFAQNGLAIGGANLSLIDGRNSFALPNREVLWGIGVSVLFHFADPGNVILHTAGVDFESCSLSVAEARDPSLSGWRAPLLKYLDDAFKIARSRYVGRPNKLGCPKWTP